MNGIWRAAPRINDVRERERRKNRIALNRYTHSYTHNMYLEMGINCMKTQLKHKQDAFILSFLFVRSLTFSWMLFKFSLISGTIDPNDIKWWNKPNQRANERNFYDERALKKRQQQQKFIVRRIYILVQRYTDLDTDTSNVDSQWIKVFPQWWITLHSRYCCCDFTSVCYYCIGGLIELKTRPGLYTYPKWRTYIGICIVWADTGMEREREGKKIEEDMHEGHIAIHSMMGNMDRVVWNIARANTQTATHTHGSITSNKRE